MDTEKKNDSKESTGVVSEENQTLIKEVRENITFEEEQKRKELAFFNQWNDQVEKIELKEKTVPKTKKNPKKLIQEIRNNNLAKKQGSETNNERVVPQNTLQDIADKIKKGAHLTKKNWRCTKKILVRLKNKKKYC